MGKPNVGSTPTVSAIRKTKMNTEKALKAYQNAINKIDDYFEYDGMLTKKTFEASRKRVYEILDQLTKELTQAK